METVNISELRANLLGYLKKAGDGHEIAVTSHGQILATLIPPVDGPRQARVKLDRLAKTALVHDVVSPSGAKWDALT